MYKVVCTFKLFEFTRNRIFVLKWAELKRVWWGLSLWVWLQLNWN